MKDIDIKPIKTDELDRSNYFSNKKTVVQFVLALLVFFIHLRVFSAFKSAEGYAAVVLDIIMSLTHVAVPLFFAISGALFYRNYTLNMTFKKWKSRFFSLCIPYFIWNTLWLILAILGYYTPLGALLGGVQTPLTFEAVFAGIFLYRFFEPFWFILQLIVLTALCPVIYFLLKNKYVGLLAIGICLVLNFFGVRTDGILISNPNMVTVYLIGAWVGMHRFEWITIKLSKKYALISLLIYIACCTFAGTRHLFPQWMPTAQISIIVTIISCVAFYVSFDLFDIKSYPSFMTNSFLIYATHSFVGAALSKIASMILPSENVFLLLNAVFTFVTTIVIICIVGKLLGRFAPRFKRILVGR